MASKLASILGEKLLSSDGEISTQEALEGVSSCVLYFSAHWCPPCRGFTPVLAEAFKAYRENGGRDCQVVFVSGDADIDSFKEYFAEMPWLAVPFDGSEELRKGLNSMFGVRGIPSLGVLNADGEKLDFTADLRNVVKQHKAEAFPMTPEHLKVLAEKQKQAISMVLQDLAKGNILSKLSGGGTTDGASFIDVMATYNHIALLLADGDCSDDTYKAFADIQSKVNKDDKGDQAHHLGVIFLGWSKYNGDCDNEKLFATLQAQFYGLPDPSQEVKDQLGKLARNAVGAPHVFVLGKLDDGSLEVVLDDAGMQKIQQFKATGYPWSESRIEELQAAQKARIAGLKEKQAKLQFLKGADGRDGLFTKDGVEVKVDALASKGEGAVIAIYFSAHWCPPCRGFTPQLAKCYKELKEAGKEFEIVFVSSDKDEESFKEYMSEMPWVALPFAERSLKEDLSGCFGVRGIPTLILLKPDGTLITSEGTEAVSLGAECFPWGPEDIERGQAAAHAKAEEKMKAAIEEEQKAIEAQVASGGPVLKRLRGTGAALSHDLDKKTIQFSEFSTIGSPDSLSKSGVVYYEVEVTNTRGVPQFGFAGPSFETTDGETGEGVGDDAVSWGFDGVRKLAWNKGHESWIVPWEQGDVIGFAANIDEGKIAVSKNGAWEPAPLGVFFTNEAIKNGVFPCMTGGHGYSVRYNLNGSTHGPFKYGPPTSWTASIGYPQ